MRVRSYNIGTLIGTGISGGRRSSEEKLAVAIYPVESVEELDELMKGEPDASRDVCRKCHKEYLKDDRMTQP